MEFDISNSIERFQDHLSPKENDRIIFSGKFGAGKTYFLKKFFKEKEEHYCSIHLFPINYSVASNEDIFELIKFDILFHLLSEASLNDEETIPHNIFLYFFLQNKAVDILPTLLGLIPKIGSPLQKGTEKAIELVKEYENEKQGAEKPDIEIIQEYLKSIKDENGNIYEEDLITRIIINLIESIREEDKEVVLIVDDLDRIDPGHLFRILNVLSAHTDRYEKGDNKYGFDKIILTFHLENVKNIYHHQYGAQTDFEGYIDKFYTSIFSYHLSEGLMNRVGDIVISVIHTSDPGPYQFGPANSSHVINIVFLISCLISSSNLTVRNVLKLKDHVYNIPTYPISYEANQVPISESLVLLILDFLLEIYTNIDEIEDSFALIDFLNMSDIEVHNLEALILSCILLLDIERNKLKPGDGIYTLEMGNNTLRINYRLSDKHYRPFGLIAIVQKFSLNGEEPRESTYIPDEYIPELYKALVPETIRIIKEKNLLANRPN